MPTRLSGMDAIWLYLETPTTHMHVGSALVLDPSTAPGGRLSRDDVAVFLERRLHLAPPFRRRVVQTPLRLDHPVWIEDPDFDLDFHVRRAALPRPGGMAELAELAGDVMSRPLDRTRPLWELHVVEGLEGGRVALVTKTHHAAVDGISGVELAAAILSLSADRDPEVPAEERPWRPEREPGDLELLLGAALRLAPRPVEAARIGVSLARGLLPPWVPGAASSGGRDADRLAPPPAPFATPVLPWNGAITPHRRVAFAELSLASVKEVRAALGGTVNDVVLAATTGAVRRYLEARGHSVDVPVVAMVPISVRGRGGEGANQISLQLVGLPVQLEDPRERLAAIAGRGRHNKPAGALGARTLMDVAELAPAGLSALAARLYTRTRAADRHRPIWNLVVSNVPGPRVPLYCAGAHLEAMYPIGPIHDMNGLNVTLFSYADTIFVGLNADRSLLGDVDDLARDLVESVRELSKLAGEKGDRP